MKSRFAPLKDAPVYIPQSYYWPDFLKKNNLLNIANQIAVIAIIAVGMTMVIIAAGIDLSVGSLVALSAVLIGWFIRAWGGFDAGPATLLLASLLGILICGAVGLFSGFLITQFTLPPFIVTLAMMLMAKGIAQIIGGGAPISDIPDSYIWLGRGYMPGLGLPWAVGLMLLIYLLAHVLMTRVTLGRYIYAVGGNAEAARLSGVRVKGVLMFVYMISGLVAGLGGVIMASTLKSGDPKFGDGYELTVIAAVVVGGTSLSGGEGRVMGTLIGALIIAVIQNGLNLVNVGSFTQKVILGAIILGAVLLDQLKRRREQKRAADARLKPAPASPAASPQPQSALRP